MDWMTPRGQLNICTKEYAENRVGGLMVCGINWAEKAKAPDPALPESFFSDVRRYPSGYTARLVHWFEEFGHPLATISGMEGAFEKSILQTNWMGDETPNASGVGVSELVEKWENMEWHIEATRPRLVIFLSTTLLDALNDSNCAARATLLMGSPQPPRSIAREQFEGVELPRLQVKTQVWGTTRIVALPHPSPQVWNTRKGEAPFIRSLASDVGGWIRDFRSEMGFAS